MAQSLTTPDLLTQPIAENGNKNVIPATSADPTDGYMAQSIGFPPVCSLRLNNGGKAPKRADINGVLNLLSKQTYFIQNGGFYTFRQDVSDAIGGYPLNAVLTYEKQDGSIGFVQSLIENNTYNFVSTPSYIDGVKWKELYDGFANVDMDNISGTGVSEVISWCRTYKIVENTIASGGANIAGTYTLGMTDVNSIKIGYFSCFLQTTQSGQSTMAIHSDVLGDSTVLSANNGHSAANLISIPFKNEITISFPNTTGGIAGNCNVYFVGYMEG